MIIDPSGRGPTMRQLWFAGICGLLVFVLVLGFLMARYQGFLVPKVHVTAELTTTGDGLPSQADVKFRGMLVGSVHSVSIASLGETQQVHIDMKPEFVGSIPANVTARVVPSNLFAITSVELLYNGPYSRGLGENSVIHEDRSRGTIALQDTLTTIRSILAEIDPMQLGRVMGTLAYALDGSGRVPGSTIERLDHWVTGVDEAIPNLGVLLTNFSNSAHALNQSAPELLDVLGRSVQTSQTIVSHRADVVNVISGASGTIDRVNELFAANPNVGKELTAGLNDTFGALAADPGAITNSIRNLNTSTRQLSTVFTWGPQRQMAWNLGLTFTPWLPYTVADCPRYGAMAGPSCANAPSVADPGTLPPALRPHRLSSADGLPPPTPMPGLPTLPGISVPGAPAPGQPVDPFLGTPLQGVIPPQLLPGGPPPAPAPAPAPPSPSPIHPSGNHDSSGPQVRPATYTGDAAVRELLGRKPSTMEYLLVGSALQGGTLQVSERGGGR